MQTAAQARSYDLSTLRARQFTVQDFHHFDLIIAMDDANMRAIEALRPAGAVTPVRRFAEFASQAGATHVPDPYYTRDFDGTLDLIELAARGLASWLGSDVQTV